MNILDKAYKVLENYNSQKFYKNLKRELDTRGLKKRAFCEKIGRNPVWFSRLSKGKVPNIDTLVAIEKNFNIDILKLAELEKTIQVEIPREKDNDEFIIINGKKNKLSVIHHKVRVILSHPPENKALLNTVNAYYDIIQDRLEDLNRKTI